MAAGALSIRQLTVWYGARRAVDQLDLDLPAGHILALLGPNGSGKSTTMAAVAGQGVRGTGTVRVDGVSEDDSPAEYRRKIGYVPQDLAIYEELSAFNNLMFFGRIQGIHGRKLRERVADALDFVHLTHQADRCPSTFSGGMKRRLNLACALIHQPCLMLLDEPTVGLDIASRDAIFDVLRRLRRHGVAVVLATHHLDEAQALCDRVAILREGRLAMEGTLDDLTRQYRSRTGYFTGEQAPTVLEEIMRTAMVSDGTTRIPPPSARRAEAA